MTKATEDELSDLHGAIARALTEVISEGQLMPVKDSEPVKVTASAAYFMAGLKMLADNNITADPVNNAAIADLNKALAARNKRRSGQLSQEAIDQAAALLERDLGGPMQ